MAKKDDDDKDQKAKGDRERKDDEERQEDDVEVEIEGEKKPESKKPEKKDDDKGDDRDGDKGDEEEEREEDDKIKSGGAADGDTDEEREEIRRRRREEKQRQRARIRERDEAKDREIAILKSQLDDIQKNIGTLQGRNVMSDIQRVESGMAQAQREIAECEEIIKRGIAEQKGDAVAAAQRAMMEANTRFMQLSSYRNNITEAQKRSAERPQVDPLVVRHAQDWMSKNKWYDSRGRDPDSRVALAIDQQLADEGMDARTPEYWKEFGKRVTKYIPHRSHAAKLDRDDDGEDDDGRDSSPTSGSGREQASQGGKVKYKLSADRVNAMKEAGMWEQFQSDAKFRARMVSRFKDQDTQQKTAR